MRLEGFDRSAGDGPLDRMEPRTKLVLALAFLIAVVCTPVGWWGTLGVQVVALAAVIVYSRLPVVPLLWRWMGFVPLVVFLAVMVALGHPQRPALGFPSVALAIVIKNSVAFLTVMVLTGVTPFARLLGAMGRLGAPRVLVATLYFMNRYVHVLGDELGRMVQARRSRSYRRGGLDWGLLTGLIGVLFVRSMERGERVYSAMVSRGWDGTLRSLDDGLEAR